MPGHSGIAIGSTVAARNGPAAASGRVSSGSSTYAINDCSAIIDIMASITIRKLEETTKRKLKVRAAMHGRSMEQEAREILKSALSAIRRRSGQTWRSRIRRRSSRRSEESNWNPFRASPSASRWLIRVEESSVIGVHRFTIL